MIVSAYAHLKNPNEDMAESLSYFIVNPDALKSRSLAKYEFVRDRIMQIGNIYISQIQENLTFKVSLTFILIMFLQVNIKIAIICVKS